MWRPVMSALALVAYALLSHWLMVHAADSPWAIVFLLAPLLLVFGGMAVARRRWGWLALMGACLVGLEWVVSHGGVGGLGDVNRLYVLQHAVINLLLGGMFAATLRPGQVPLITAVALRVHGSGMQAAKYPYTRRVTVAWTLYFFGLVAVSLPLYFFFDWSVWSVYSNLVNPLLAAALMFGEWRLRYWLHPEFERVSIGAAMRAFRAPASTASTAAPR